MKKLILIVSMIFMSTTFASDLKITPITTKISNNLGEVYNEKNFKKYTSLIAPNGKPIHILAQSNISDEQILRCRNILKHYLTDYKSSVYGNDKSKIANKIAENNAILVLLNGEDNGENPIATKVTGQPLYQNEIQVEGGSWYINQEYNHRDASFEEILHFVHDNGIGVDGNEKFIGAALAYQKEIRKAQENALKKNLWGVDNKEWIKELTKENSLSQEYLAAVVDSYYGLWGAYKGSKTNGMWGLYVGKTREDMKKDDPMGYELMNNKFFHPYLTYNARIDPKFKGTFSLKYDKLRPYTNHSRYLKDITLLGNNNSNVIVNELDNEITGNSGINTIIFSGKLSEYDIKIKDNKIKVIDNIKNRDGVNTLYNIEKLQFFDETLDLSKLKLFINKYIGDENQNVSYVISKLNLNKSRETYLVTIEGNYWCGTGGCTNLIIAKTQNSFKIMNEFLAIQDIKVLNKLYNNWGILKIYIGDGGSSETKQYVYNVKKDKYIISKKE